MADLMDMGFAGAYYGMQDKLRKDALARDESQLRQAAGAMSLADMLRKQQVDQQLRGILANNKDPEALQSALMAAGPEGVALAANVQNMNAPVSVGPGSVLVRKKDGSPLYANPNDRSNGTQTERAFRGLALAQRKVNSGQPLTPEEELDAQVHRAVLSQERIFTDPATGQQSLIKPLTIPSHITVGIPQQQPAQLASMDSSSPSSAQPMQSPDAALAPGIRPVPTQPGAPSNAAPRKPLDQASEKELQGFNDASKQMGDLFATFQPTYGGFVLDPVADVALKAGRRLPESVLKKLGQEGLGEQANWWQRYANWSNDIRAAKFGLTLTGNELTAFEKATAKPSDTPEQIQQALKQQMEILANKQRNRLAGLKEGGYNMGQASATAGPLRETFDSESAARDAALAATAAGQPYTAAVEIPRETFNKPKGKVFDIPGSGKVIGQLRADGNYYTQKNGKFYRIEGD